MLSERSEHETEEEKRKAQKEEKAKGNRSGSSASFKPEQFLGRFASFWPDSDKKTARLALNPAKIPESNGLINILPV